MPLKFFYIRTKDPELMEAELNRFVSSHRVVTVERRFVDCGTDSFWALCVDYLHGEPSLGAVHGAPGRSERRVDYKEVLSPEQFERFAQLRELRKQLAEREAVPVYAVFTNDQLAEMIKQEVRDVSALKKIQGVGDAKIEKFSGAILALLKASPPEKES